MKILELNKKEKIVTYHVAYENYKTIEELSYFTGIPVVELEEILSIIADKFNI